MRFKHTISHRWLHVSECDTCIVQLYIANTAYLILRESVVHYQPTAVDQGPTWCATVSPAGCTLRGTRQHPVWCRCCVVRWIHGSPSSPWIAESRCLPGSWQLSRQCLDSLTLCPTDTTSRNIMQMLRRESCICQTCYIMHMACYAHHGRWNETNVQGTAVLDSQRQDYTSVNTHEVLVGKSHKILTTYKMSKISKHVERSPSYRFYAFQGLLIPGFPAYNVVMVKNVLTWKMEVDRERGIKL